MLQLYDPTADVARPHQYHPGTAVCTACRACVQRLAACGGLSVHLPIVPLLPLAHSWRRRPPASFRARHDHCNVLINLRIINLISEDPGSLFALNPSCT